MESNRSTASTIGIVAGVLLVVGSFLTWATVSIDAEKFAAAFGVSVADLGDLSGTSTSATGMDGSDGWVTLIAGVVALALAVLARKKLSKGIAIGLIVAGVIGGGIAAYDLATVNDAKQEGIDEAAPSLEAMGIERSVLDDAFTISPGIGIWMCLIGGVAVIVAGVMARGGSAAVAMPAPAVPEPPMPGPAG